MSIYIQTSDDVGERQREREMITYIYIDMFLNYREHQIQ